MLLGQPMALVPQPGGDALTLMLGHNLNALKLSGRPLHGTHRLTLREGGDLMDRDGAAHVLVDRLVLELDAVGLPGSTHQSPFGGCHPNSKKESPLLYSSPALTSRDTTGQS